MTLKLFQNPDDGPIDPELSLSQKLRLCLRTLRMLRACCVDEDLCGIADGVIRKVSRRRSKPIQKENPEVG